MRVGELLRPISGAMAQELLIGNYIQADETRWAFNPREREAKITKLTYDSTADRVRRWSSTSEWAGNGKVPNGS